MPFPLGSLMSDDEGSSPGPSSFESTSSQGFGGLRCVTPPSRESSGDLEPRKLSPFKKKNKPVLPSVVDSGSPICSPGGVNPFESSRMRKARSCETFLQEQDEIDEVACKDVQTPIVESAMEVVPTRSILRSKKGETTEKKRSARWAPDVMSPLVRATPEW